MIPDSFVEELKFASNIVDVLSSYINLTPRGRLYTGLCPFHSEKTPSFTVYPQTHSYHCFGCGNGGDVITFVRQMENLEYVETIRFLAQRAGLVVPESEENRQATHLRQRILEVNRESGRFFHSQLMADSGQPARGYLAGRGFSLKSIRTFGVGFAPESWDSLKNHLKGKGFSYEEQTAAAVVARGQGDHVYDLFRNRIIFPIIDLRGNVIAFGGRLLGEKGPKYLNSPDTAVFKKSRQLYSLNFAKNTSSDTLILGEGYMDVMAMYQAGFENSVATLGTALTPEQARLIAQYAKKVIIAYDSDGAGQSAAKRAINLFSETTVSVSVLELKGAKDPDEYIKKYGSVRFGNLLEEGKSAMDFEIDKIKSLYNFSISEDKVAFLGDFSRLMSEVSNPLQRDVYITQVARELEVSKDSILTTVNALRKRRNRTNRHRDSRQLATSISKNTGTAPSSRKGGIEGVKAEELLITLLLLHPDQYSTIQSLVSADDFHDPGYKTIYSVLEERLKDNLPLDLIHFSSALNNPLMAKLSQLIVKGSELHLQPEQGKDYADAITAQTHQRNQAQVAEMTPQEYEDYLGRLRSDKK